MLFDHFNQSQMQWRLLFWAQMKFHCNWTNWNNKPKHKQTKEMKREKHRNALRTMIKRCFRPNGMWKCLFSWFHLNRVFDTWALFHNELFSVGTVKTSKWKECSFTRNTTFGAQPISIYSNQSNGLSSVSGTKSNIISWTERWLPSIIKCRNRMRRISYWQFHLCWKFHIHYYQIKHFIKMILIVAEIENMRLCIN